jgi:hypothetical protein
MQKITTEKQFISILEMSVGDSEFLNMPNIGFKAETDQNSLNKGGKANLMLTEHGIDITKIVKKSSGTALCSLGNKGYMEVVLNSFLKQYKDSAELPKSMTNQKVKEIIGADTIDDYKPKPRRWGVRVEGDLHNCLVEHKGHYYLTLYFVHGTVNKLKVEHTYEGNSFDPKSPEYSEFLKASRPENKVATEILGVPFKFSYRDYKLCSIKYFSCRGNKYEVAIPEWE